MAYTIAQTLRFSFDVLAGFKFRKATEDMYLNRMVFLETVAGRHTDIFYPSYPLIPTVLGRDSLFQCPPSVLHLRLEASPRLSVRRLCAPLLPVVPPPFLHLLTGIPGMAAGMIRHLNSLRRMQRDHGWIHTLLEEAENERMHLLTFMRLKRPGPFFRAAVLVVQGVFFNGRNLRVSLGRTGVA